MQDQRTSNIYVSNIPLEWSEAELVKLFESSGQGKVMSSRILMTEDNRSRGVGFARMDSRKSAVDVIAALNGYTPDG